MFATTLAKQSLSSGAVAHLLQPLPQFSMGLCKNGCTSAGADKKLILRLLLEAQ